MEAVATPMFRRVVEGNRVAVRQGGKQLAAHDGTIGVPVSRSPALQFSRPWRPWGYEAGPPFRSSRFAVVDLEMAHPISEIVLARVTADP